MLSNKTMPIQLSRPVRLAAASQLVLVLADDRSASVGVLQLLERGGGAAAWHPVGSQVPVSLGRGGLAWGLSSEPKEGASPKREGDGCSPMGIFPISALFGVAGPGTEQARVARLPYLAATPDLKAVDDPASLYYNRIVDQTTVAPDWCSCEDMWRPDRRYEVGAVVGYNTDPVVPGAGSCIFLHVWEAPGQPTAGCTAMAREDMLAVARWLDGACHPLLVQLPRAVYRQVCGPWGLPPAEFLAAVPSSPDPG